VFERYTKKARRVVFFARFEASQYGSSYIETEHLLLGLIRKASLIASPLRPPQVWREQFDKRLRDGIPCVSERISTSVEMPLVSDCKRALRFAVAEAQRLAHRHISPEHLFSWPIARRAGPRSKNSQGIRGQPRGNQSGLRQANERGKASTLPHRFRNFGGDSTSLS